MLIIDELGYLPLPAEAASHLVQVVSRRYEHGSIILTTNRGIASWGEIFDDQTVATAARSSTACSTTASKFGYNVVALDLGIDLSSPDQGRFAYLSHQSPVVTLQSGPSRIPPRCARTLDAAYGSRARTYEAMRDPSALTSSSDRPSARKRTAVGRAAR